MAEKFLQKKKESLNLVKNHLETMKIELDAVANQIKLLEKNKNSSEWDNIDFVNGQSVEELRLQEKKITKEISSLRNKLKKSKSKSLLITELFLLPVVFLLIVASGINTEFFDTPSDEKTSFNTRLFVENLRGDTVDTWKSWRLVDDTLNVNIVNSKGIPDGKINVITNAITSEEILEIDDSFSHKGPKGSTSIFYSGWAGALEQAAKTDVLYNIPVNFNVIQSYGGEGDIIITLSNLRDNDGYTGYTKSIVDGNEILKSFITIYDISNLTDEQLSTIVRHEFGHALGLGHSTAPEDLMAPTIDMTVPYISECNIDAIVDLYNGVQGSTVCEK